jgi:preprotein translocase subunit SecG
MPNLLPDWHFFRPAGRLIWFTVILIVMLIPVLVMLRRPKSDRPTTWAQAMAGAVYVFAITLLAYAIIPHEFITFCDNYLQWGKDKYIIKSTTPIPFMTSQNWPFSIDMQAIRDVLTVGIYIVFFAGNIALFVLWQDRKTKTEDDDDAKPVVVGRSRFGRPLRAKG